MQTLPIPSPSRGAAAVPAIVVTGFGKDYDDFTAVHGLTFSVDAGEIVGLVGANGAGKTTTLRALAGLLRPSRGAVCIAGHDLAKEPLPAKRALAYLPDTSHPYELLTVREHLQFTALAYGVRDAAARLGPLLEELELSGKTDAIASTLSRGMTQKLALACAFLRQPRAVVLDEPLTGLDPLGIRRIKESIRRRAAEGTAFLLSSHLLELVEAICDRVLIIHRGRLLEYGTLAQIRDRASVTAETSLEDTFFAITERHAQRSAAPPQP